MSSVILLVGASVILFVLVIMLFGVSKNQKDDDSGKKNRAPLIFQLLLLGFISGLFVLIGNVVLQDPGDCEWLINDTQTYYVYGNNFSGYHWDYDGAPNYNPADLNDPSTVFLFHEVNNNTWDYYCEPSTSSGSDIFYWITVWVNRLIMLYILGFLLYNIGTWLIEVVKAKSGGGS